jgi:hypothetical protein
VSRRRHLRTPAYHLFKEARKSDTVQRHTSRIVSVLR